MSNPVQFGLTGLGNYAGEICERLLREQEARNPRAILKAVCDPRPQRNDDRAQRLRERGIAVVHWYDDLLAQDVDCLWLPLPIDLHRSYTEQGLAAGKHVLCEKPAAAVAQDTDSMIAARDRSGKLCAVGYQDLYQPAVWELKRRLLAGEFGIIFSASVLGCWPRAHRYYTRNDWAGKLHRNGEWILDSPAMNAFAHYIHLAQFLMGATDPGSATPSEVEAELYRVNPIENYDTCSIRLTFDGGAHQLIHLTHACRTSIDPQLVLRTQFARIRYLPMQQRIEVVTQGVTESIPLVADRHTSILEAMHQAIRCGDPSQIATLDMSRAHAIAISAASAAAPVVDVPAEQVQTIDDKGSPLRLIPDIEQSMQQATDRGRMLHECGIVPWSKPAGHVYTDATWRFEGIFQPR